MSSPSGLSAISSRPDSPEPIPEDERQGYLPTLAGRVRIDGEYYQNPKDRFGLKPKRNKFGEFQITDMWCRSEQLANDECLEIPPDMENAHECFRKCWCHDKYQRLKRVVTLYEPQIPEVPRLPKGRTNLIALSQAFNLYFCGFSHRLYVYRPRHPRMQLIPAKADLMLFDMPTSIGMASRGYQNPRRCHDINHVAVGFLGTMEVVVTAHDNGDVIVYDTSKIEWYIRFLLKYGRRPTDEDSVPEPKPLAHYNASASAWGIAIHQKSRLIAVTTNKRDIVIFAPAIHDAAHQIPPGHSLNPHFRERDVFIYIPFGNFGNNMPSVDFLEDKDGYAQRVVVGTIFGDMWTADIWKPGTAPRRYLEFQNRDFKCPVQIDDCVWTVKALSPSMFVPCATLEEALVSRRPRRMPEPLLFCRRAIHFRSVVSVIRSDRFKMIPFSVPIPEQHRIDLSKRDIETLGTFSGGGHHAWLFTDEEALEVEDVPSDNEEPNIDCGFDSEDDYLESIAEPGHIALSRFIDYRPAECTRQNIESSPRKRISRLLDARPRDYEVARSSEENSRIAEEDVFQSTANLHMSTCSGEIPKYKKYLDVNSERARTICSTAGPRLYIPYLSMQGAYPQKEDARIFHTSTRRDMPCGEHQNDEYFFKNSQPAVLLVGFKQSIGTLRLGVDHLHEATILQHVPSRAKSLFRSAAQFSMSFVIPDLSLVVMGNSCGEVYLLTPTKVATENIERIGTFAPFSNIRHGFRVEARLPECVKGHRGLPRNRHLFGMAVSPIFEEDPADDLAELVFDGFQDIPVRKVPVRKVPKDDGGKAKRAVVPQTVQGGDVLCPSSNAPAGYFMPISIGGTVIGNVYVKKKMETLAPRDDVEQAQDELPEVPEPEPSEKHNPPFVPDTECLDPDVFVPWRARRKKRVMKWGVTENKWRIMLHYSDHSIISYIISRGGDGKVEVW